MGADGEGTFAGDPANWSDAAIASLSRKELPHRKLQLLQKWSEVDWWVLAGLAVGWTPAKTKEFQLSHTDKEMVKVLAQESEQAAPAKFAKVVQAGVGQARVDADGDAHMIISNDLMARTFECCFCKKFYPADSDNWSRY